MSPLNTKRDEKTVYLAGAITGIPWDEARAWRQVIKEQFVNIIDPCDFPWNIQQYEHGEKVADENIVNYDTDKILNHSHVVLVKADPISWGTAQEQYLAYKAGKTVVTWVIEGQRYSGWVRHHSSSMVNSLEAAIKLLKHLGIR